GYTGTGPGYNRRVPRSRLPEYNAGRHISRDQEQNMAYSMTAFARSESSTDQGSLLWELRSVNHRYLEVSLRLPEAFRDLEGPLRERLRTEIARGKLASTLRFNPGSDSSQQLSLNQPVLAQLVEAASQITSQLPPPAPINPLELLS